MADPEKPKGMAFLGAQRVGPNASSPTPVPSSSPRVGRALQTQTTTTSSRPIGIPSTPTSSQPSSPAKVPSSLSNLFTPPTASPTTAESSAEDFMSPRSKNRVKLVGGKKKGGDDISLEDANPGPVLRRLASGELSQEATAVPVSSSAPARSAFASGFPGVDKEKLTVNTSLPSSPSAVSPATTPTTIPAASFTPTSPPPISEEPEGDDEMDVAVADLPFTTSISAGNTSEVKTREARAPTLTVRYGGNSKPPIPTPTAGGGIQKSSLDVKTANQLMYSFREAELIQEISRFLIEKEPSILTFLFDNVEKSSQPSFAYALVTLSFTTNTTLSLLKFLLEDEFEKNCGQGREILRENGVTVLGRFISRVCSAEKHISSEIDPSKVEDAEELEKNKAQLEKNFNGLLDLLTDQKSTDAMPMGIRVLLQQVAELAQKYKPESVNIYLGSFLMLRYINPALFSPENFGLFPAQKTITATARRNLILMTKVMQNLVNDVKSNKKEAFMNSLNYDRRKEVYSWFGQLINVKYNPKSVHDQYNQTEVTVNDLHILHNLVFNYRDEINKKIKDAAHKQVSLELNTILDKLGSYQNKENFSNLKEEHQIVKTELSTRAEEPAYVCYVTVQKPSKKSKAVSVPIPGILIIGLYRIIFLRENGKVGTDRHQLELVRVKSLTPTHLELVFSSDVVTAIGAGGIAGATTTANTKGISLETRQEDADNVIAAIVRSFDYAFPSMPKELRFSLEVSPPERRLAFTTSKVEEACDGMVQSYRSLSDLHKVAVVEDVCWDLENLWADSDVFDFSKFTELYNKPLTDVQILPLLHALSYNRQFTTVKMHNIKFQTENTFKGLIRMVSQSTSITSLHLSDISIPSKRLWAEFFQALRVNSRIPIKKIVLWNNFVEDTGVLAFAEFVTERRDSFLELDFTGNFSGAPLKNIMQSFTLSTAAVRGLESMKWGKTKLTDFSTELGQVLMKCQMLTTLCLPETAISLPTIVKSLKICRLLRNLDISRNKFKENQWQGFKEWLQQHLHEDENSQQQVATPAPATTAAAPAPGARARPTKDPVIPTRETAMTTYTTSMMLSQTRKNLQFSLDISATSIPLNVLEEILLIQEANPMRINASNNNLGLPFAQMFSLSASKISCVEKLDISDNNFTDHGCALVIEGLCNNSSVIELNISNNFQETNSRNRENLIHQLDLLSTSICPLEVLQMRGTPTGKLKESITKFIYSLRHNTTITHLDLTGHSFGDKGAIALARLLQQNFTLNVVVYDGNDIGPTGLLNLADAIKKNQHIQVMPTPFYDVAKVINEDLKVESDRKYICSLLEGMATALTSRVTE